MGRLSESWSRWWREGGGGHWPRLRESQAQLVRYLILLLGVGVILMSLGSRETGEWARPAGEGTIRGAPAGTGGSGSSGSPGSPGREAVPAAAPAGIGGPYARELEAAVRDFLSALPGVRGVQVHITLAAGPELVVAEQVSRERRESQEPVQGETAAVRTVMEERYNRQPVLLRREQGREDVVVLRELAPSIQGAVVVVHGTVDGRLRLEMTRAVAAFLGVPVHQVYVLVENL